VAGGAAGAAASVVAVTGAGAAGEWGAAEVGVEGAADPVAAGTVGSTSEGGGSSDFAAGRAEAAASAVASAAAASLAVAAGSMLSWSMSSSGGLPAGVLTATSKDGSRLAPERRGRGPLAAAALLALRFDARTAGASSALAFMALVGLHGGVAGGNNKACSRWLGARWHKGRACWSEQGLTRQAVPSPRSALRRRLIGRWRGGCQGADVTRIHTPAPAKDWTNEGTHTQLNPPHKGPLHIPPARCTTVAAWAVLLDTRTTKAARKV